MKSKTICFVIPSLKIGGMERVMSEIVNYFSEFKDIKTVLILLRSSNNFPYDLKKNIKVIQPKENSGFIKTFFFLRKSLIGIKPYSLLSFGNKYNSFVILASLKLNIRVFVSDRSNPRRNTYLTFKKDTIERHDGIIHFLLKRTLYKKTHGIFAQTLLSKKIEEKTLNHKNVYHIPNPIKLIENQKSYNRENIILNVGRFIKTKQQLLLIDIFHSLNLENWKLVFLGDGPELEKTKEYVSKLSSFKNIIFKGSVSDVDKYYSKSKIFAFTSISEGFPNVLAEALNSDLACISFDCEAGPSDLIINEYNGFLVSLNDVDDYKRKMNRLVVEEDLRDKFVKNNIKQMKKFDRDVILGKIREILVSE